MLSLSLGHIEKSVSWFHTKDCVELHDEGDEMSMLNWRWDGMFLHQIRLRISSREAVINYTRWENDRWEVLRTLEPQIQEEEPRWINATLDVPTVDLEKSLWVSCELCFQNLGYWVCRCDQFSLFRNLDQIIKSDSFRVEVKLHQGSPLSLNVFLTELVGRLRGGGRCLCFLQRMWFCWCRWRRVFCSFSCLQPTGR